VLAAGEGKRMRSRKAKVLHEVAGKALVLHALDAVAPLAPQRTVVVVGHQAEQVEGVIGDRAECALQAEQLGTGHAVLQAKKALAGFDGDVMVLCGDVPLLSTGTLRRLRRVHRGADALATVLGMIVDEPDGYGRLVTDDAGSVRIVEHADADAAQRMINEVNTGTYCFDARFLLRSLGRLGSDNAQREYYLTDVLEAASGKGRARTVILDDGIEGMGVNSRADLAAAEAVMQDRLVLRWMERGVTFVDPASVYLSARARLARDVIVGPYVRIDGQTRIGEGCTIDGACHLKDTIVDHDVHLLWGVVTDGARIGAGARVGPYSHLRPEADLGSDVHVGNFVEVKKSTLGRGSKANHLTYIGDATIGRAVNVGAGTITCNYDGFAKYRTVIGDRVQIGSDTQLVAPVELGADCYVAAGSTVVRDVEPGALVLNDKRQIVRPGWVEGFRARARAASGKSPSATKKKATKGTPSKSARTKRGRR
jgi:bifunctional UDP-N-acetylglucosamine pyrophosphorylase/glucosamine-1-phosphate N-acetyltransferase